MKIITVVGARPQFIKASAVSRCIHNHMFSQINEIIIHTGQHFDFNMSEVFFEQLEIPEPQYYLNVSGGSHAMMTSRMMPGIEEILLKEMPDKVLVYGDTNSTLATALVASKLHIPLVHVEAGLRSFNRRMPEETNRIVTDHLSEYLFCPSELAVKNLINEGITQGVHFVGDVMFDVALYFTDKAERHSDILGRLDLLHQSFVLVTCHRAENTDDPERLENILSALSIMAKDDLIVFPMHPRVKKYIQSYNFTHYLDSLMVLEPLSYLDFVRLQKSARLILTDSGGIQKEAFFYRVPCMTMRDETEWTETVDLGWNQLVGSDREKILLAYENMSFERQENMPYGTGCAAKEILRKLQY